ncbi:hypothetical protein M3J09_010540 [Ascochyta lentis]
MREVVDVAVRHLDWDWVRLKSSMSDEADWSRDAEGTRDE